MVGDMLTKMSSVFPRQGALCRQGLPWGQNPFPAALVKPHLVVPGLAWLVILPVASPPPGRPVCSATQ